MRVKQHQRWCNTKKARKQEFHANEEDFNSIPEKFRENRIVLTHNVFLTWEYLMLQKNTQYDLSMAEIESRKLTNKCHQISAWDAKNWVMEGNNKIKHGTWNTKKIWKWN